MRSSFWVERADIGDIFRIHLLIDSSVVNGSLKPLSLRYIRSFYRDFLVVRQFAPPTPIKKDEGVDEIVGCCAVFSVSDVFLELRSFVVDEHHRGLGIAKMLMCTAICLAKKRKKSIFCFSQKNAFFGKFGFSEISRKDLDVDPRLDWRYAHNRRETGLKIYLYTPE